MKRSSFALATAAAAALAATAPVAAARAQDVASGRVTVEPYLAQYSIDNGDGHTGIGGFGARVMFGHADATRALSTFFQRARAGVFFTYTSEQKGASTFHAGGEGDFPLFNAPIAGGFLDPFVSLGAGVFHFGYDGGGKSNDFALTPAAGTLIPITGSIKLRGDIRDVIIFGDNTTNNLALEGGISIGF